MNKFDCLTKFDDYLKEQLKDPVFKAEYDALDGEYLLKKTVIEAEIGLEENCKTKSLIKGGEKWK